MTQNTRAVLINLAQIVLAVVCASIIGFSATGLPTNFPKAALTNTLVYEGGYSNHPRDPGGVTLEGIIQTEYDKYRVGKKLAKRPLTAQMRGTPDWTAERNDIYQHEYWEPCGGALLPKGLDFTQFDYCVNSGIGRGGRVLRRVLKLPDTDWHVTPQVIAAVKKRDARDLITAINNERLAFVGRLSTCDVFCAGWRKRIRSVNTNSLAMAGTKKAFLMPSHLELFAPSVIEPIGKAFDEDLF